MTMITENPIVYCVECKDSIEYCFCSCPYCGEITENCHCNLKSSRDSNRILPTTNNSKLGFLKQSKKASIVNTKDDDWERLEKWQIGRSRFP